MANGSPSSLPAGFVLDAQLPEGFVLDKPEAAAPEEAAAETPVIDAEREVATGRGIAGQRATQGREQRLEELRKTNPALAQTIEETTPLDAFLIGAGGGFTTLGRGLGLADEASPEEAESFSQLQDIKPAAIAGEVVAEAAPFVVPGTQIARLTATPLRVLASGLLGATEGGLISAGKGRSAEDIAIGAAIGFGLGAGGEALLPVVNRLGRKVMQKAGLKGGLITPDGQPSPELVQALDQQGSTVEDLVSAAKEQSAGDITGNAQREAAFSKLGITPTEAQRTRDIDLFVDQQDAFRKSGKVRGALDLQESQLTEKTAEVITDIGSSGSPSSTIDAITDRSLRLDNEITDLYQEAKRISPVEPIIRPTAAIQALKSNASRKSVAGGVFEALRDEMRDQGVLTAKGLKPQAKITVEQSERLRQFANSLFPGATPQGKQLIREFKDSLQDDTFSAVGDDIFNAARSAKRNFELGLSKEAKNKFDKNRTSLIRDMLENKIAPEDVPKILNQGSKYKAADLQDLKRYLSAGTPEDIATGSAAWTDLRSSAMERIRDSAFTGPIRGDGSRSLSRAGIEKAFKQIGAAKINVLFSKQERGFLRDLAQVAAFKEPPPGTFAGTGPTGLAVERAVNRIAQASNIPGAAIASDVFGGLRNRRLTRIQEKRVLKLVDDMEVIRADNAKNAFNALRKSQLGEAATAAPFAAIPLITEEEQ